MQIELSISGNVWTGLIANLHAENSAFRQIKYLNFPSASRLQGCRKLEHDELTKTLKRWFTSDVRRFARHDLAQLGFIKHFTSLLINCSRKKNIFLYSFLTILGRRSEKKNGMLVNFLPRVWPRTLKGRDREHCWRLEMNFSAYQQLSMWNWQRKLISDW